MILPSLQRQRVSTAPVPCLSNLDYIFPSTDVLIVLLCGIQHSGAFWPMSSSWRITGHLADAVVNMFKNTRSRTRPMPIGEALKILTLIGLHAYEQSLLQSSLR